ncbi:MAG: uracil-DNA glycosylase family protein [Candidatus Micrarchaeia archaeon]
MKFEFSAGFIVVNSKQFLLLKNPKGWLDLPKGIIEKNEDAKEAAIRELEEETGLKREEIKIDDFFEYSLKYFFYTPEKEIVTKIVKLFLCETEKNEINISTEHIGYVWLGFDEVLKKVSFSTTKKALKEAINYLNKKEKMKELNEKYENEIRKKIKEEKLQLSENFVPGEGNLNAKIFIVGQAPGREEDEQRRPFVGKAGKLLDEILKKNRIKRRECYITSVVQFFPFNNREPTKEEVEMCLPYLKKQISIVEPKIIVLLGNVAANAFGFSLKERGYHKSLNYNFFVTFHPAAALRGNVEAKKALIEDFKKIKELLGP